MKKSVLYLATTTLVASGSAWAADSYRLAFSKAENIEIFVEHAAKDNWCSPQLDLRVVYGSTPDQGALAGLMSKLGALLDKQCPQATALKWTSWDSKGVRLAQGTSAKAEQWALAETKAPAPAVAESPAAPDSTTPAAGASILQPVARSAEAAVPATTETPAPIDATPASAPALVAPTVPAAPASLADFTVNGWKPLAEDEARKKAAFLSTMQDQNGCNVVSNFNLGEQAKYVTLKSEGLACGEDGYLEGKGRLVLERSDGVRLTRTPEIWLAKGIPFDKEIGPVSLAETDGKRTLWFALGHDESTRTYYLLRSHLNNFGGMGIWQIAPRIDAVTAQPDMFRQAEQIQAAVQRGIASLQQSVMPSATSARLVFAKDFQKGIVQDDYSDLLYAINANRAYDWRTRRGQGEWKFNLQTATNYLFQQEERMAREKRYEEQRKEQERRFALQQKARQESQNLDDYRSLAKLSEQNPAQLRASIESDVRYQPVDGGRYARLVAGGKAKITRIVRVNGHDGADATVDWPYAMRLIGQSELDEKWYVVAGELSLDPKRRDDEGLPLSLVMVKPGDIQPCAKEGCTDMTDPLAMMRLRLRDPAWTPETAQALINEAQQP